MPWINVTDAFLSDLDEMEDGVVLASDFDLSGALSAIELMDENMDRGMMREEGLFLDTFRFDYLLRMPRILKVVQEESSSSMETVQLMDRLFCLETTWLSGMKSFPETLLTCLPTHRPDLISNEPLRLYVLATLRTCQMVEGLVRRAGVCEAEEFFRNTFSPAPIDQSDPSVEQIGAWIREYDTSGSAAVGQRLERILLWMDLIASIHGNSVSVGSSTLDRLVDLILAIHPTDQSLDADYLKRELGIVPSMASYYLVGCPKISAVTGDLEYPEAVTAFANLLLSLRLLHHHDDGDDERGVYHEWIDRLWGCQFHPLLASALFLHLHTRISALHLEQAAASWLGLAPHVRLNIRPIQKFLLDTLQISCQSPAASHANLHKLLLSIQDYLGDPGDEQRHGLYVVDYLKWWRSVLAVRAIILGLSLQIYEEFELPEAFWVLSRLLQSLAMGRQSNLALLLAHRQQQIKQNTICHLYGDCRFAHRWTHLLPHSPMDISVYQEEILAALPPDMVLSDTEQEIADGLASSRLDHSLLFPYFMPDILRQKGCPPTSLSARLSHPL